MRDAWMILLVLLAGQAGGLVTPSGPPGPDPPLGQAVPYLAGGVSGGGQSIGQDSSGAERPNDNPCP